MSVSRMHQLVTLAKHFFQLFKLHKVSKSNLEGLPHYWLEETCFYTEIIYWKGYLHLIQETSNIDRCLNIWFVKSTIYQTQS